MHTTTPLRTAAALSTAVLLSVTAAELAPPTAAAETVGKTTGTISTEARDVEGTTIPAGAAVDWTTSFPGDAVEEGSLMFIHTLKNLKNVRYCPSTEDGMSVVPLSFEIVDNSNNELISESRKTLRTFAVTENVTPSYSLKVSRDADSVTYIVKTTLCTASGAADPAGTTYEYGPARWVPVDKRFVESRGTVTVPGGEDDGNGDPDTPPVTPPTGSLGSLGSLTGSL